jgi:hypothetical protein
LSSSAGYSEPQPAATVPVVPAGKALQPVPDPSAHRNSPRMSPPGRHKGEYRSAQREGNPISRRTLLKAGLAGGAALFLARWLYTQTSAPPLSDARFAVLDERARSIVSAIVPVLLAGALPTAPGVDAARAAVVVNVDQAIAGLPPASRKQVEQLFALLAFAPSRCLIAGVWSPWPEASSASIAAFLTRWRDSRFALLQTAYGALHQLIVAAWYGSPLAWPAIGYPGPPSLEIG